MKNNKEELWQFRCQDTKTSTRSGVALTGARRNARGRWLKPEELPTYVASWFLLERVDGVSLIGDYDTLDVLRSQAGEQLTDTTLDKGVFVACASISAPTVDQAKLDVPTLEAFSSGDGAHWGISDFYGPKRVALLAALESGKDFSTGWYGSKKEIASGCVTRAGRVIHCEASVSDDFDTAGTGRVTVKVGRKSAASLLDAIERALNAALGAASEDRKNNSPVILWSVHNEAGQWIETYLQPSGDAMLEEGPPGDNYHRWYWQGEARIPRKVKDAFERMLDTDPEPQREFTSGKFTFKRSE